MRWCENGPDWTNGGELQKVASRGVLLKRLVTFFLFTGWINFTFSLGVSPMQPLDY